jgi:hypothetical protein
LLYIQYVRGPAAVVDDKAKQRAALPVYGHAETDLARLPRIKSLRDGLARGVFAARVLQFRRDPQEAELARALWLP